MSIAGVIAATLRQEAPYAAEIQMGAQLILDFQGARTGGRPYYWYRGTRYSSPEKIPGWSFSRASAAIAETRAGALVPFAPGVPAITDRGLSVWEARTNKVTCYSANPSEGAGFVGDPVNMAKGGDAAAVLSVVYDSDTLSAAGLSRVCTSGKLFKVDNSAGGVEAYVTLGGATGNTSTHAFSAWVKGTGRLGQGNGTGTAAFSGLTNLTRIVNVFSPASSATGVRIFVAAGSIVYFILPDLEEGAFVTPPIVTEGAAATRAADSACITGLGSILMPPFTMQVWTDLPSIDGTERRAVWINDGTVSNEILIGRDGANAGKITGSVGGVGITPTSFFGKTGSRILRLAARLHAGDYKASGDGTLGAQVIVTPPTVNNICFGARNNSQHLNGHLMLAAIFGEIIDSQLGRVTG